MLSINVFRGASEQHCFKIGVWRAILIQKTWHLDSIVARALLLADFIESIGHSEKSALKLGMSAIPAGADIRGPLRRYGRARQQA